MISEEEKALEPFFNSAKYWNFEELLNIVEISKPRLSYWLKKFEKEGTIKRPKLNSVMQKSKMPYYTYNFNNSNYHNRKAGFTLKLLNESGLIKYLQSLKDAKVIIIYGSFISGDWYDDSDVDVFIYGNIGDIIDAPWVGLGWKGLLRVVEFHTFQTKEQIRNISLGFMKNVAKGYFVKGDLKDLEIK